MRIESDQPKRRCTPAGAQAIGRKLERWRIRSGRSRADLELIASASQGQISRILSGKFTELGGSVELLCQAAGINVDKAAAADQRDSVRDRILTELDKCWDGSEAHAELLIEQLRLTSKLSRRSRARKETGLAG